MAMHEHNEDLILELLDGPVLTTDDISARLDDCDRCISDLSDQRAIAAALAELDPPTLAGDERAALRSGVLREIEPAAVIPLKRAWDWTRMGTVAAALVGVVAVAGVFSVIGGGNADESGEQFDTATAGAEADFDGATLSLEAAPVTEEAADDAAGAASSEMGDTAAIAAPSDLVVDLGAVDTRGFRSGLDDLRSRLADTTESSGVLQRDADEAEVSCLGTVNDLGAVRAIAVAVVDGLAVEVYLDNSGGEFAYAGVDCSPYPLP